MRHDAVDSLQGVLSAEEALRFLDEVAAVLIGSLDYEQTLGRVAQLAVPLVADWCAVDIVEDDGSLRQITSGHPDPDQEELLKQLRVRYRAEKGGTEGVASVIASGQPELRTDVRDAARIAILPEEAAIYDRLGPKSYVIVPLAARGRTLGALTLLSTQPGRHYGPADMPIAMHLARRSSLAIDNARLYDTAEKSLGLLDTLFTTAPVGLGFVDTDLRFVRINEALAAMNGLSIEEHLGRTIHEVLGPFAEQVVPMYRRALDERRPVLGQEMVGFTPGRPAETRYWVASYTPVIGLDEQIIGVGTVVIDVTEERHALEAEREAVRRATFLAEAGALLDASMDPAETLDNLARLAVPGFADWCTVHLLDEDGDLRQVAVAHADPEKVSWAWELSKRYPADVESERGVGRVLQTGRPEVLTDVSDELLVASAIDEEHLAILRELGLTAAVIAPLTARGRTLGALSFVSAESSRRYGDADVQLLVELGRRAGVALENAQLYTERSRIAHTLQARLLPSSLPSPPGLELAARYRAAGQYNEVGGDFYDAFERAPDEWVVVIGDVSGKGPEAAAMTALARYTIRSAALSGPGPCDVLRRLNESLLYEEELQFITVAVAYLAPGLAGGNTAVRLALGGHPPPFVLRADGTVEQIGEPGLLLGIRPDPRLAEAQTSLAPGDSMLLYTDGVTEAGPRGAPVAEEGLARLLASMPGAAPDELVARIDAAAHDADPGRARDDVALLAVHALAVPPDGALELTRPAQPQCLRELRDAVVEFARELPDLDLEGIRLAVGEACTNVVAHAYREESEPGPVYLRATVSDEGLVVEIRDEGCGPSPRIDSPGLGLGLPLMKHLSRELEITSREPAGTLVRLVF